MTTGQDKIAQYLHEAHAMELALTRTLEAHRTMARPGAYRDALDTHLRETRGHANAVARRLRELGRSPGLAERGYGIVQRVAGQLVALGMAPLDLVRGGSHEEKLLKNAKDECASEALEIATYEALEALARQLGDTTTAALAADIRADEERMLETLSRHLPALTAAVTGVEVPAATARSGSSHRSAAAAASTSSSSASRTRRATARRARRARRAVRSRRSAGASRRTLSSRATASSSARS